MPIAACLLAAFVSPSLAQLAPSLPDAERWLLPRAASAGRAVATRRVQAAADDAARRVDRWLGLVGEAQSGRELDAAAVREEAADGLARGRYKALILGESHSVAPEKDFARSLIALLLSRGLAPAALLREQYTYDDASALAAAGVPVADFRNQFQPDPEIDAALRRWRGRLATYSGHAHSCERVKDYVQNVLLAGLAFGYGPGKKDMPTIERAFVSRGLKPAIVSMVAEDAMLGRVEALFLKDATASGPDAATLAEGLRQAIAAWDARLGALPGPAAGIHFYRHPKQDNLILGITRGERRPLALSSALSVVASPEAASWLGPRAVTGLESLRRSSGDERGNAVVSYEVIVHRADGARFERDVPVR